MNYLTYIMQNQRRGYCDSSLQFLVSGEDKAIRESVLQTVLSKIADRNVMLVVNDGSFSIAQMKSAMPRHTFRNALAEGYGIYNPLRFTPLCIERFRHILSLLGYQSKDSAKLIRYLKLIKNLEEIETKTLNALTPQILWEYDSTAKVERRLNGLVYKGAINMEQLHDYLSRYRETAAAGADFEDHLALMEDMFDESNVVLDSHSRNQVTVFNTADVGLDLTLWNVALQLMMHRIEDSGLSDMTFIVIDALNEKRKHALNALLLFQGYSDVHLLTQDVFSLGNNDEVMNLLSRFPVRIFSRHESMDSCGKIEKSCGNVEIIRQTTNVTYDRRWKANGAFDVLFGNNKTVSYIENAPVVEPRYRKEDIARFRQGTGIVVYQGNATVFSL